MHFDASKRSFLRPTRLGPTLLGTLLDCNAANNFGSPDCAFAAFRDEWEHVQLASADAPG